MADRALTAKYGGAASPDDCVVVVRSEVLDELMRAHRATDLLAFRQGLVGGMIAAALVVGVAWLCGWIGADGPRLVGAFAFGGFVVALWYRIWDASACSVTFMGWELKDFAASLYKQGMEEARGGRADG